MLGAFLAVYLALTPYNELTLFREGNAAAAISLEGAITGYVLPLSRAIAQSVSVEDMLAWCVIALVAQVAVYFVVARAVPRFPEAVKAGRVSGATLLAARRRGRAAQCGGHDPLTRPPAAIPAHRVWKRW